MPVYTYPGTGGAGSHPYQTPLEHGSQEPFTLANPLNAAEGPGLYSDNMWYQLESLHDVGIQMALLEKYRIASVYRPFVPVQVAMRTATGAIAEEMTWKGIYAMEPNTTPVGTRQIWFSSNFTDTFSKKITFLSYADKVALHAYDQAVQAYLFRGSIGLIPIARTLLGESVTVALDVLARNAYLEGPRFHVIAGGVITHGGAYPNFSGILNTDTFDLDLGRDVWESLAYEDVPMAANPNGPSGTLFCVTTPSTLKVVKSAAGTEWRETHLYANPGLLLRYELGMWEGTRFLSTRRNVLWNCGSVIQQSVTQQDYGPGDGADNQLIDKVYQVGQTTGVTNGIELDAVTNLAVNDIITIHQTRTSAFGVTNGVDYREGTARVRRITRIAGNTIYLDKPLFHEFPAGSFVTKGTHVHVSLYVAGPGVVNGVGEPIMMYPKEPIDDANAIWRFIWRGRFKYQTFLPEMFHIVFHGGGTPPVFGIGTAP